MPASLDRRIAEAVAAAGGSTVTKLGLRFDRVALRVMERLRDRVGADGPKGLTVVVALTAPLRVPARLAAALEPEIVRLTRSGLSGPDWKLSLVGNDASLRLVGRPFPQGHGFLGFVHNADVPAERLLDLAERWLRSDAAKPS